MNRYVHQRIGIVAGLGLIIIAASATTAAALPFVTQSNGQFVTNGTPFKFVGFHYRGITHYGHGDVLPYAPASNQTLSLDTAQSTGVRVIRAFIAYNGIDKVETGNRLQTVLDLAEARGIYVICALTDFYKNTLMHPQGDTQYYVQGAGYEILGNTFYASGYLNNYVPQAEYLADRFKNHPAIFAWEIGNELRNDPNSQTFTNFCLDVASKIRAKDPNHMVTTGVEGWSRAFTQAQAVQVYTSLDCLTQHNYHGGGYDDSAMAAYVNKPFFVEEAGFASSVGDRPAATDSDIAKWVGKGASGYIQWGVMATTYDNGDGDTYVGMDRVFHTDWFPYLDVYSDWADVLNVVGPLIERSPSVINVTATQGHNPANKSFTVRNSGDGTLSYSITDDADWLSVDPPSGTSTGETDTINVIFDTDELWIGTYTATITITDPQADNSPATLGVHLTVDPVDMDADGDGDVDVSDFAWFSLCFNGANRPPALSNCDNVDADDDSDVDVADFAKFSLCFNGSANPPGPSCPAN